MLVIDDSAVLRAAVRQGLHAHGAIVLEADSAEAALVTVGADLGIDVVLLDVELPGLSGFDVAPQLVAAGPAVVFLTGRSWGEDVARAFDLGAVDYLRKPFDPIELLARVRAAHRLKAAQDELRRIALIDPLTQTSNRRHMEERLDALVARAERHGHGLSVLLLDLNGFKALNDQRGHQVGDRLLTEVAQRAKARLRRCDEFGRWGGDEFLALLPDTDRRGADAVRAALHAALTIDEIDGASLPTTVTAAVGAATWKPGEAADALVQRADAAMYQDKRAQGSELALR